MPAITLAAVLAIITLSTFVDPPRSALAHAVPMRPSFVGELAVLFYVGTFPMTLVALAGAAARCVSDPPREHRVRAVFLSLLAAAASAEAAGAVYDVVGSMGTPLTWPWQAMPLAAAVVAYTVIATSFTDLAAPRVLGVPSTFRWPLDSVRGVPSHAVGAAVAAGIIELVRHQAWTVLPVVAVPLYFAWVAYDAQLDRGAEEVRHVEASSPEHGLCRVDPAGRVTTWNSLLASWLDCPAPRAIGRWLNAGVPALGSSALPRAVQEALGTGTVRTVPHVVVPATGRARVLSVTIVPDARGALLVWSEAQASAGPEPTKRESSDAFALANEGANEGLWVLDEPTRTLQVSARWRELLGLPPGEMQVPVDEWFARVHEDDRAGLQQALEALADGTSPTTVHEHRVRRDDGVYRRVQVRCIAARQGGRRATRLAGSLADVTEAALAIEQVKNAGTRDALTELLSRSAFVEHVAQRLESFKRQRTSRFAVIHLDLDRFKVVNDSLGHVVGDQLLVAVARRLEATLRSGDLIARLSGDEFAVMLNAVGDEMQANVVGFRLQEALKAPFPVGGREVVTSASIGIAISRADHAQADDLMRDSDTAMCQAKAKGKARHELFDADTQGRAQDRLGLESDLRDAVNSSGFEVHYQPIVSLTTRRCIGFESLVRWNRHGAAVSPADFIPMAEELGIIEPLGTWVMQQACRKFVEWKQRFPEAGLDCITVNVSARQLVQQGFIYLVEQTVEQNRMRPADLRLEITETALMDAPQFAAKVLGELREYGVQIYLDDFGTGYSSLSHLHKLPVDALKIDRSFVRGLLTPDRPAIVESILALARTLHTNVVAEGIEDERQAIELERLGCRHAQGYYFSRPIPATEVEELLASGRTLGAMRVPAPQPARATLLKEVKREIA